MGFSYKRKKNDGEINKYIFALTLSKMLRHIFLFLMKQQRKKKIFRGWEMEYYSSNDENMSSSEDCDSSEEEEAKCQKRIKKKNVRTIPEAIVKVFEKMRKRKILSPLQISKKIATYGFYYFNGKTPIYSVGVALRTDISKNGEKSRFVKVSKGRYKLRQ